MYRHADPSPPTPHPLSTSLQVEHYKSLNKDALQLDRITKEELVQLLVSKQICAWGECYRAVR